MVDERGHSYGFLSVVMVIFTKDMSTGSVLNHGVSGYQCLGQAGDFQTQQRGEPWENIANDPIRSYMNAQSHIGVPMSNFNEPWNGGVLQEMNWSAQPYRTAIFGEPTSAPAAQEKVSIKITSVDYPAFVGDTFPQQLPSARIHNEVPVYSADRQNEMWEDGIQNGDNKVFMPQTIIPTLPNTVNPQGASTATGVHPQNDKAGQATTANTGRADLHSGGQTPYQKLPNGQTVGALQPGEPGALWELAPPPDPVVLPGEGTAPLAPTTPAWW
jgi:hypothetical protein